MKKKTKLAITIQILKEINTDIKDVLDTDESTLFEKHYKNGSTEIITRRNALEDQLKFTLQRLEQLVSTIER